MIDLVAPDALRTVGNHGSVVAAADALGFTPSAVSQQVKRLERQTGVPLLERVGRGVMGIARCLQVDTTHAESLACARVIASRVARHPARPGDRNRMAMH